MITRLESPRTLRRYLVYDMEWVPGTLEIRMVGVYDGKRYRYYRTVIDFLNGELTSDNRGRWFYAHAGGLADFQFVLQMLLKSSSYRITGSFSGSSAIIVRVTRGKNSWTFVDSYWLLREKLRNIGKWIGIHKGNEDESVEFYSSATIEQLREYNEIDCVILFEAIAQFESVLLELGGMLKMTQASCAMDLFRRRFLKRDIDTSMQVNRIARHAYVASRVEVLATECDDAYYYDINSSFPYAMTMPVPGDLIGTYRKRLPDRGIYLADVTLTVPDSFLPPLPRRFGGRIFFPVGTWRGWFTSVDIELLLANGGTIETVHESMAFEPITDLRDYALTLYDLRKRSEGFFKVACKYLLNSLYGKFAESEFKSGLVANPETPPNNGTMLMPGIFIVEREVPVPHMHVPISAHITAIARRTIYEYMSCASEVHYCDTDGFSTTSQYQSGNGLGELKLEKYIRHGRFVQAKVYHLDGTLAESGKDLGDDGVKAKGFSRMTLAKMNRLINGDDIEYVRMARIKEVLRSGNTAPRESVIRKRLHRENISKRFFYPDGQSRAWHVDELANVFPDD